MRPATIVGLFIMIAATGVADRGVLAAGPRNALSIRITSPLGRTGLAGPIRIVAQVRRRDNVALNPVKFYIDDKPFGEAEAGPPFAVEWVDDNPFEQRDIAAEV